MTRNKKKESKVKQKRPCVYILCNKANRTLYVGVTSDLQGRIYQHKNKSFGGFTAKYNVSHLAYFEF
ncbi:GIY-YIG nuclease family protein [Campylobacter felis]|uniref:GIY-YIG nuclease family protein n=1 Tax=Campylobacter felis TaxID=2974565 RepID=UPI002567368B|nr:GIY-YIG nuclease family protein [Campylobacter felis]MDL0109563.1 GIY-YIG nuclease family protein [Campylobacter felis]